MPHSEWDQPSGTAYKSPPLFLLPPVQYHTGLSLAPVTQPPSVPGLSLLAPLTRYLLVPQEEVLDTHHNLRATLHSFPSTSAWEISAQTSRRFSQFLPGDEHPPPCAAGSMFVINYKYMAGTYLELAIEINS